MAGERFTVRAPGRVNLIGEHTDYTGGLVLPMAIDRYTTIQGVTHPDRVQLRSADEPAPLDLPLAIDEPHLATPPWARYVAGVIAELSPPRGCVGTVDTTIPIGAGLSSSAALEVATALALGIAGPAIDIARLCQRAEHRASGVPCGIMDQLSIAAGVAGHATMIDCDSLEVTPVALPDDVDVVVHFIAHRTLVGSPYADRVRECAAAESAIGPLRCATPDMALDIDDPVARRRAQHVTNENRRVLEFRDALAASDLHHAGRLMVESHESLRDLYDTSTPVMDRAVAELITRPGVYGSRMTGGGFGGCVVTICRPGAVEDGWLVRPVGAARLE